MALALVASASVVVNPLRDAAQASSGDFSVDFTAAAPESYNHLTGGGAFDDRTVGVGNDIVESLEGGDFACGDVVTYFAQVVVDDTQSADDDAPQTIELDFSFLADTTGQSGVAIGEFVDVKVNYGAIEDLIAGENGVDDGLSDDGGSVATLTAESLTGPLFASGSELLGTVELTDLERNEEVVVRIDVKLFCDPGSNPTGNLQGQLDAGRLAFVDGRTPVDPAQALSGGAQTVPFKQTGNIASPAIAVDKTVTTETGTCPGVETLTVQAGDTVKYCYNVANAGEAPLYSVVLLDDNGTPGDTGDDFTVAVTGLADTDLDGGEDDLAARSSATGEALVTLATAGTVVNTATATGDDSIIQPTRLTASDTAEVIIDRAAASLSVDKTISSGPVDNLDGTFTIVYEIDVTNADTAGAGEYDLADEATFSPGVTIESQAVTNTAPGSIATDATFPTSGTIVVGETILPGASHTYEVTVVARLEVDTTTTYEECSSTTGAAGEGLFNRASLTVDGETTTDDVCADIPGDLMIEKSDGDVELAIGDGPFEYQLTVTNVGGASTGSPVIVTDVLPDEFRWVDFPDTAGEFPFCTQADQVLTCEIDSTLVDAGGESTDFLVSAEMRDGTAESIDGYENLSYVNSPSDPAPSSPSCEPQAASSASSSDALIVGFATPTNNVACDRTPVRPSGVEPIDPPTTPPTTVPPTMPPPPTVPPEGLPRTGSSGSMNMLGVAALLLGLGVGLTLVVRRRQQQA